MSLEGTMSLITRPEVASRVTSAVDAMDETIKEIRAAIFGLQDRGVPSQADLRADIVALVEEMTPMLGFAPSLRLGAGLGGPVSPDVAEHALAALREALSNAARHADASEVDVSVDVDSDGILAVQVTDNGIGLPLDGRRSGLRNLAARAEKLGGELRLGPADPAASSSGTRLEWRAPCGLYRVAVHPVVQLRAAERERRGDLHGRVLPRCSAGRQGTELPTGEDARRDTDEVLVLPGSP
jgi:signal transduction histidine kinase